MRSEDIKGNHFEFIPYLLCRNGGAKDFLMGLSTSSITISSDDRLSFHHIFLKAKLRERGLQRDVREEVAKKTFPTNRSKKRKSDDPIHLLEYNEEALESHLMVLEAGTTLAIRSR